MAKQFHTIIGNYIHRKLNPPKKRGRKPKEKTAEVKKPVGGDLYGLPYGKTDSYSPKQTNTPKKYESQKKYNKNNTQQAPKKKKSIRFDMPEPSIRENKPFRQILNEFYDNVVGIFNRYKKRRQDYEKEIRDQLSYSKKKGGYVTEEEKQQFREKVYQKKIDSLSRAQENRWEKQKEYEESLKSENISKKHKEYLDKRIERLLVHLNNRVSQGKTPETRHAMALSLEKIKDILLEASLNGVDETFRILYNWSGDFERELIRLVEAIYDDDYNTGALGKGIDSGELGREAYAATLKDLTKQLGVKREESFFYINI